ncbi:MAG: hypothetical protein NPIRA04_35410 [Nitrospirales bacterium]|nr:MAG: hypothetical protein NPIRA04_35410 [Nitrospirales bacterium]
MVSGKKIVLETLTRHPTFCQELLYSPKTPDPPKLPRHVMAFELAEALFQKIDTVGTAFPLLICQTPKISSADLSAPPEGLEVLCPLGNPMNLGIVIRSCSAFGVQKLILLQEAANPFHPKAIRSSSGAVFNLLIEEGPEIQNLTDHELHRWVVSLDLKGRNLSTWEWPQHVRLLIGEEGLGLPDVTFPHTLMIPQTNTVDSLNAATAASIALFAYRRQFPLSE